MDETEVARRLMSWIREQGFRPGERLGSERALASSLDVSRPLLRRALATLEADGEVQRWLGRTGGVFRSNGRIQRQLNTVQGVPEMVRQQGMTLHTVVLSAEVAHPRPEESRSLRLADGENVFRVRRLRLVDGESWSLDLSVLPASMFPGLLESDLTGSLYGVLRTRFSTEPDRAEETLETAPADEEQSRLMGIEPGAPLLEFWRVTFRADDAPMEFAHDFFRADRTRVHMQRLGTNWKRAARRPQPNTAGKVAASHGDSAA